MSDEMETGKSSALPEALPLNRSMEKGNAGRPDHRPHGAGVIARGSLGGTPQNSIGDLGVLSLTKLAPLTCTHVLEGAFSDAFDINIENKEQ
jgi:hypothetical protein